MLGLLSQVHGTKPVGQSMVKDRGGLRLRSPGLLVHNVGEEKVNLMFTLMHLRVDKR